jgi:hypothetical protein
MIINPQFIDAFPFHNSKLAAVKSGRSWGYIDWDGKIAINPQFDEAITYNGDIALIISGRNYGLIDEEGKYIVNPQYDDVSTDLLRYVLGFRSPYESVETEFFNVAAIARKINLNNPEDLDLNCTVSDVMTKFGMKEESFNSYYKKYTIKNYEKITNDVSYSFSVVASPFERSTESRSYFKKFNPLSPVTGFDYEIGVNGKGADRENEVMEALISSLKGFDPDPDNDTNNVKIFTNNTHSIRMYIKYNTIHISIRKFDDSNVQ